MDWTSFFIWAAGAAATLMGLLFVGVRFHMDTLIADLRWQAVARSTFAMYVLLFTMPLMLLIPTISNSERSLVLLAMVAFGVVRAVRSWLPVWGSRQQGAQGPRVADRLAAGGAAGGVSERGYSGCPT